MSILDRLNARDVTIPNVEYLKTKLKCFGIKHNLTTISIRY